MKSYLILLMLMVGYFAVNAQTLTVTVPTVTAAPGQTVTIPVKLTGASSTGVPISSANIQITFNNTLLTYVGLVNFYTGMPQSQWIFSGNTGGNGIVAANWYEPSLNTVALPDSTTLFAIQFTYLGGSSPLTFILNEFTDIAYNIIPTTPVNGAVNAIPVYRQVTFKVDMSRENITSSGVHLAGSFNNWSYTQTPMTLLPNSIYEVTVSLQENVACKYRFVNGNNVTGLETVPASCGVLNGTGQYDRQYLVAPHDTTFLPVCFSMCSHCPANVSVTFRVDMQNETVSPNGVHVSGTFNSWNYAQNLMTVNSGTVYETSMNLDEGTYMEFRYVNGNSAQNMETVPSACALNNNRYFTVPGHDTVMTAYCFSSCVPCGTVVHYSHVTFRVDMHTQTISPDGVHLAGTFQGWNPSATAMITTGDSIYSFSDSLLTGTSVQYKFVNGNTVAGYESVPFACSSNGDRTLLVPANDTILKLVCFSACDTCGPIIGVGELQTGELFLSQNFPNPCTENTRIAYRLDQDGTLNLSVFNSFGRMISTLYNGTSNAGSYSLLFDTRTLPAGIYFYRLNFTDNEGTRVQSKKMIIQ